MPDESTLRKFKYSPEDIVNLIKSDVAKRLGMETIPIIDYSIIFEVGKEDIKGDWLSQYTRKPIFKGALVTLETP